MNVTSIATIVGAIATVVAIFPLLQRNFKLSHRMRVKRIQNADDPDLVQALELYARCIPENERDTPENIIRWFEEVEAETREGRCKLKDYFLVAKVDTRIAGFLYSQYYPKRALMFISFMAVDRTIPETRSCLASIALLKFLNRELRSGLKDCEGMVFELEYAGTQVRRNKATCEARMRHFRALARTLGLIVREVAIDYRQPRLSLWDSSREERQHLMYGRTKPPILSSCISKTECEKILAFIYNDVYGDHYEDDPTKDVQFRQYLGTLYLKTAKNLPNEIVVS